ncbi:MULTISPECIES: hypothetical protein [Burkholderia cepacia complex]|uniref:hypothetical protein n=1 Tax=Burkholderia cepacia complex TaxID=87882 RepID=UPI0007591A3E|nr:MULTISPECIES: hypothetical protein [Burkholderia cepacia complex]KVL90751.1 hypothetical protein WT02_23060 [Burkholderia stagnalis]KVL93750.1 hypothetical protein WT03_15000 [Burkholderia stagnalis]KVM02172.1 hypothetical protein WT04_30755 [Burkholderia stagnalis]KVM70110.1 hypothetical protein WJ60_09745 [Burkholderia ubonensis]
MHLQEAKDRVRDVWHDSAEATLCLALVDLLAKHRDAIERVSFGLIDQVAREHQIDDQAVVAGAVQYLIGHDLHLLDPIYEYIDDDDHVYVVRSREMNQTLSTGAFHHPLTGEIDPDYESKVFLSFSPSVIARELREAP